MIFTVRKRHTTRRKMTAGGRLVKIGSHRTIRTVTGHHIYRHKRRHPTRSHAPRARFAVSKHVPGVPVRFAGIPNVPAVHGGSFTLGGARHTPVIRHRSIPKSAITSAISRALRGTHISEF